MPPDRLPLPAGLSHAPQRSSSSGTSRWILALFLTAALLQGCDNGPKRIGEQFTKRTEMQAALDLKLPAGTTLEAARAYMISQGFEVVDKKQENFHGKGPFDFLMCTRHDGEPPVKRLWEAALVYDSNGVSQILCQTALAYL